MVREENVKSLEGWFVTCQLAGGEVKQLMDKLLKDAEIYHNQILMPVLDGAGVEDTPIQNAELYGKAVQDDIDTLLTYAVRLPKIPIDEFCETARHLFDKASQ